MEDRIEQIDAMRLGVDYKFTAKIRGFTVRMRPLSVSETVEVSVEVQKNMSRLTDFHKNRITEDTLIAKETLKVASTSDVGTNDPMITEYILDRFTNDELMYLYKQYIEACDKANPALEMLSSEQVNELIEVVKKNAVKEGLESAVTSLTFSQLASVVCYFLTKKESQ